MLSRPQTFEEKCYSCVLNPGLRKVNPYYFTFTTFTTGRWVGERILDVFAREFRAHPAEEYVRVWGGVICALEGGDGGGGNMSIFLLYTPLNFLLETIFLLLFKRGLLFACEGVKSIHAFAQFFGGG